MPQKSKSSRRWLQEHFKDTYVKKAKEQGYRSRAVFKLKEILQKDKLLKKGMNVLELGAAPGGWTQIIAEMIGQQGNIWAIDLLPMNPISGVTLIQGDPTDEKVFAALWASLGKKPVDVLLSDMAPNLSGIPSVDQAKIMYLAEWVLDMAHQLLKPQGSLVMKLFQGEGYDAFLKLLRQQFTTVSIRKPAASRSRSNEVYLVAKGYLSFGQMLIKDDRNN